LTDLKYFSSLTDSIVNEFSMDLPNSKDFYKFYYLNWLMVNKINWLNKDLIGCEIIALGFEVAHGTGI